MFFFVFFVCVFFFNGVRVSCFKWSLDVFFFVFFVCVFFFNGVRVSCFKWSFDGFSLGDVSY